MNIRKVVQIGIIAMALVSNIIAPARLFANEKNCSKSIPEVCAVEQFELPKYLGTWYEIARLDHPFERGLTKVTAEYSMRDDGKVRVLNRGVNEKNERTLAEGKAYLAREEDKGYLKVSFFGPFYAPYIIFELGEQYEYAFVGSSKSSYLWFLSRTPQIDEELRARFLTKVTQLGYDTDEIIFVAH